MPRTILRAPALLLALTLAAPALAQRGPNDQSQGSATTQESKPTVLPGTGGTNITPTTQGQAGGAPRNNPASSSAAGGTSTGTGALRGGQDVTTGGSAAK